MAERTRPRETVSDIKVNAFPKPNWEEWEKDCKERFGDCRWMKMWFDHSFRVLAEAQGNMVEFRGVLTMILDRMNDIEDRISKLQPKEKEEDDSIVLLGGKKVK